MTWWHEVDTTVSLPVRFQIPRGYCEYGKSEKYSLITLSFQGNEEEGTEFLQWFQNLENKLIQQDESVVDSRVKMDTKTINLKYVDGFTQIFDENNTFLIDGVKSFANTRLDCLVEIDRVYGPMKDTGTYGITCRIFQVRVVSEEEVCMFT